MLQIDDKLEELRTICRLHGCPTGRWEDLADLPLRLSQDVGLRSHFVEIVRSLQSNGLSLPEVLDTIVLAVGGESAPKHSRQLSEQLSLLGGFLSGVGRWPGEDARPILAPGEVPENIHQFSRPQPRSTIQPPAPPLVPAQVTVSEQPPAAPISPRPQPVPVLAASQAARLPNLNFESRPASEPRPEPKPASEPKLAPEPGPSLDSRRDLNPIRQAQPVREASLPSEPRPPSEPSVSPISDIARALARLERGNLELRAHLDSIDQRISRMEPLLESAAPPDAASTEPAELERSHSLPDLPYPALPSPALPSLATRPEPTSTVPEPAHPAPILIHRNPPSTRSLRPTPVDPDPLPPEPTRAEFRRPEPVAPKPLPPEPLPSPAAPPLSTIPQSQPTSAEPNNSTPRPKATTPFAPRFSRFSTEPGPLPPDPAPAQPRSSSSSNLRPLPLPHGFLGTVPPSEASTEPSIPDPPRRGRGRHFALVATLLILFTLVGGAFFLYSRTITGTADDTSAGISPTAAPSTPNTSGPLTTTPTNSPANSGASAARVLGARSSFQPRQASEVPGTSAGFRPAGTFVPSSIMEGHLLSAPPPDQSRLPASARSNGVVVMEANISNAGQVEDVHILGGNTVLRSAAIDAVRNWQYKPYLLNGNPVEVRTIIRIDFAERHAEPAQR